MKKKDKNKGQINNLKAALRLEKKKNTKLLSEMAEQRRGMSELATLLNGYFAILTHKSGGKYEIDRNELNELMNKYTYNHKFEGDKIVIYEVENKKEDAV